MNVLKFCLKQVNMRSAKGEKKNWVKIITTKMQILKKTSNHNLEQIT